MLLHELPEMLLGWAEGLGGAGALTVLGAVVDRRAVAVWVVVAAEAWEEAVAVSVKVALGSGVAEGL